jgi:hypothetical protein
MLPRPVFSGDFGGGGGGDENFNLDDDEGLDDDLGLDGLDGDDAGDNLLDPDGDLESNDDGTITDDFAAAIGDLFKAPDGNGTRTGNPTAGNGNPKPPAGAEDQGGDKESTPQEVQAELAKQINTGLAAITLPEDIVPEDFNPSDPKQMRSLLTNVSMHGARAAISLMMTPMQVGLGSMAKQLRKEMLTTASTTTQDSVTSRLLEANVPAYKNPKLKPMVDMVLQQAKTRFPGNPQAQVKVVRKIMASMGTRSGSSAPRGNSRGRTNGESGALDLYAPMAGRRGNQNQRGNGPNLNSAQKLLLRMMAGNGKSQ